MIPYNPYEAPKVDALAVARGTLRYDVRLRAGMGSRLLAHIIDFMVVWGGGGFVAGVAIAARHLREDDVTVVLWCAMGLTAAIQVLFQALWGQSLGKRAMKIRVVNLDGRQTSLFQVVVARNAMPLIISTLCGVWGLVDVLYIFTKDQRCLHDRIAKTVVVADVAMPFAPAMREARRAA